MTCRLVNSFLKNQQQSPSFFFFMNDLSLSTLSLLHPATSLVSLFSTSAGGLAGGNVGFLSPLVFPYFHAF